MRHFLIAFVHITTHFMNKHFLYMYFSSSLQWHIFFTNFSQFFIFTVGFCLNSLLLKEPTFITKRSCNEYVIPLCIAGECMSAMFYRYNDFAFNTVCAFFVHCWASQEKNSQTTRFQLWCWLVRVGKFECIIEAIPVWIYCKVWYGQI